MRTVRRVCRKVKRWRSAAVALRWTAAGMMEAAKGFRRLKAYRLPPILRAALLARAAEHVATKKLRCYRTAKADSYSKRALASPGNMVK